MKKKPLLSLLGAAVVALASVAAPGAPGNNIIEEVAWMVGDQPIYKSEIEEAYQQMLYEKTPVNGDPYCVVPEQLAIEKLFLHQADMDTVEVQESMVAMAVDQRLNYLITNLGSKEKLEEYFRKPMSEFRTQMSDMMRNQYRIQQVQASLTKDLKVTPSDVRRYFSELPQDSIPFVPLQVECEIITINPKIPQEEIDDIKSRLRQYADRVNKGERDFSTLATLYSEDPGSSVRGGEIGFMGRGHLEPEYAAVAFNLNDTKKVSKIVETQYGYHIIQLIEKRGDRVNTRHILLRPKVSDQELTEAIHRLDSVRANIVTHKRFTFEEAAPILSQDKDTRNNQGRMLNQANGTTRFEMKDLPQEVAKKIDKMQVGDVSEAFIMKDPKRDRDIVAIVKLTQRIPAHRANLSEDYQTIKGMYENSAKQKMVKDWLAKKIRDTYVKIEDNWADCEFEHPEWLRR
ncbi:MAG: peptidylprolyl isomerase [Muribaculaceae bacterium]|nr:peptidylprolyl isomerase [Muribaculaceae bacterium]MDE6360894.1 peptidylprolyl isomerase [Muribaculaceae bacterium]